MEQRAEEEFAAFVHAQSASLFRTAYLLTGDHQRAEDLLHNTLVRSIHWSRVSAMEQPGGFARRVLVNEVASFWRRRSSVEPPMILRETNARDRSGTVVDSRAVWDAVLTLPPRQRAVLVLRYSEDLSEGRQPTSSASRSARSRATRTRPGDGWRSCWSSGAAPRARGRVNIEELVRTSPRGGLGRRTPGRRADDIRDWPGVVRRGAGSARCRRGVVG